MRTDLRAGRAACLLAALGMLLGNPVLADEIRVRIGPDGIEVFSNLETDLDAPPQAPSQAGQGPAALPVLFPLALPAAQAAGEEPAISENIERLPLDVLASVAAGKRFLFDD